MITCLSRRHVAIRVAFCLAAVIALSGCTSKDEKAKAYYDQGMKFVAAHDTAKATVEFKNAVQLKKDYTAAWLQLAKIEEDSRNYGAAASDLQTIIELQPNDVESRVKLARLLLVGGKATDALKIIDAGDASQNQNANILALKATILFRLRESTQAVELAHTALNIDPKNAAAMSVLAADRLAHGEAQAALEILDSAELATDGKDLGIELGKLRILDQIRDWPREETLLKKLIAQYPDQGFQNQLVRIYLLQKRPDDAVKELRANADNKPNDPAPELALVRLLASFKGPQAAHQELEDRIKAGIKAGNDVFIYQLALAQFDYSQGDFDSSKHLLESLIASAPAKDALTARVTLAQMYVNRKQLDEAEPLVSQILQQDGRNTSGLALRASIRMNRGQFEPAIADLRTALNDQPHSTELMILLGTAYERNGAIELADRQFADALRTSNYDPGVGLAYVAFLQRRGSGDRAEEILTDLVSRWPQNKQLLSKLADAKLARKDWVGAEAIAEKLKKLGGDTTNADEILGAALLAQDKSGQAIDALQSAYTASPSAVPPMLNLVRAYVHVKQTDKAITLLQNVLKADPANAEAYVLLGDIAQLNNSTQQAIDNFKKAIEKQPKETIGYQALANLYLTHNNLAEAQKVIQTGLQQLPESGSLRLMWAGTLEQKGDYDGAIAQYQTMLDKDPSSLIVINNLASLLADHKTDKASRDRAQSLVAPLRKSPIPQFKDTLGWVSYQNGNYREAIPLLEQAAAALQNDPDVHYHLGMAYIAAGQLAKAAEQLNLALGKGPNDDLKKKIEAGLQATTKE